MAQCLRSASHPTCASQVKLLPPASGANAELPFPTGSTTGELRFTGVTVGAQRVFAISAALEVREGWRKGWRPQTLDGEEPSLRIDSEA